MSSGEANEEEEAAVKVVVEKFQEAGFSWVSVCVGGYHGTAFLLFSFLFFLPPHSFFSAYHQHALSHHHELADHEKRKCPLCPKEDSPATAPSPTTTSPATSSSASHTDPLVAAASPKVVKPPQLPQQQVS